MTERDYHFLIRGDLVPGQVRRIIDGMIETLPFTFPAPHDWAAGPNGSLFIATNGPEVFRVDSDVSVHTIAGREQALKTGVPLYQTYISRPIRMAFGSAGTFYVADTRTRAATVRLPP